LSGPARFNKASRFAGPIIRVNGKIRAREVRVIDADGSQVGILPVGEALTLARARGVDLVEIAPNAEPPVCRVVDFGKFRYEQAKKEKESRKHQHAGTLKEIQLSVRIDAHDLGVKVGHAIGFLCEDMKVKVALRFKGREMQHTEFGFQVVQQFLERIAPYGHADFQPKLNGRSIVLMVSPLPRNKRAKHPDAAKQAAPKDPDAPSEGAAPKPLKPAAHNAAAPVGAPAKGRFVNNPFNQLETQTG
jgi:translation initiation factor IF-3